jgi:hypothetical protein
MSVRLCGRNSEQRVVYAEELALGYNIIGVSGHKPKPERIQEVADWEEGPTTPARALKNIVELSINEFDLALG